MSTKNRDKTRCWRGGGGCGPGRAVVADEEGGGGCSTERFVAGGHMVHSLAESSEANGINLHIGTNKGWDHLACFHRDLSLPGVRCLIIYSMSLILFE